MTATTFTPRRSAAILASAVAAVVVFVAMVLTSAPSHAATTNVTIVDYAFSPASITVHVGDTITWTNQDTAPHTVTSSSGPAKLDSPQLEKGQSWSFTFTKAGDYEYYCAVHPDMKGKVIVVGDDTATTAPPSTTTTAAPSGGSGSGSGSGDGMNMGPSPSDGSSGSASGGGGAGSPSSGSGSATAACPGLVTAMVDPFVVHFDKAHLETSPGQQAAQATDVDQYTKTHTVLFEDMLAPATNTLTGSGSC